MQEIRKDDGNGSWRRRGVSIVNTKLKEIHEIHLIKDPVQLFKFLPNSVVDSQFSTKDLSSAMSVTMNRAQKICYSLKKMSLIEPVGKKGRLQVYQRR